MNICVKGSDCVPDPDCSSLPSNAPGRGRRAIVNSRIINGGEVEAKTALKILTNCENGMKQEGEVLTCAEERKTSSAEIPKLGMLTFVILFLLNR